MHINGLGFISPQHTHSGEFPFEQKDHRDVQLACIEPEYKNFIPPRASRRMSRIVKMGVTAALMALKANKKDKADAVITGTGFGCLQDTEKFMHSITKNQEKYLNPALFIHSTHNTISSQIALLLQCTGYNQTYVHGPFSFEAALLDGIMLLKEGLHKTVLVGGVDEMTSTLFAITKRFNIWKKTTPGNQTLFSGSSKGTLAGEGAGFFKLQPDASKDSYAQIIDVHTAFDPSQDIKAESSIDSFLEANNTALDELDLCFLGKNGDSRIDNLYTSLQASILKNKPIAVYKHLCGEYFTASAFAVWLSAQIIKQQQVPDFLMHTNKYPSSIKKILIVNRYRSDYLSLILLAAN